MPEEYNEGMNEGEKKFGASIEPEFLFRKILGQPEFAAAYRDEIAGTCKGDAGFCAKAGAEWSDEAFAAVADTLFDGIRQSTDAVNQARKKWPKERYQRFVKMIDERTGNLSLVQPQGGELSLADENGKLSLHEKK